MAPDSKSQVVGRRAGLPQAGGLSAAVDPGQGVSEEPVRAEEDRGRLEVEDLGGRESWQVVEGEAVRSDEAERGEVESS